jgi:hypothetical protein
MSLIHSFNDTDFFFRQAVEFIDAAVYLVIGDCNLGGEVAAVFGVLVSSHSSCCTSYTILSNRY